MSCNVLSHYHWAGSIFRWGGGSLKFRGVGGVKKRRSPDFRSPEVGISVKVHSDGLFLLSAVREFQALTVRQLFCIEGGLDCPFSSCCSGVYLIAY